MHAESHCTVDQATAIDSGNVLVLFAFIADLVFVATVMEKLLIMTYTDADRVNQLWGEGSIRIFISHIARYKVMATELQERLTEFGVASFVAHEDIEPTAEWQTEIERALFSMDMFIALLTEGFNESDWTDQEVGFALGRGVPIICISRGKRPYGFIAKYQAIPWGNKSGEQVADEILGILLKREGLRESAKNAFIMAVATAYSFARANSLTQFMPLIDELSFDQEEALVQAFNSNYEVYNARHFYPRIVTELRRMTGSNYTLKELGYMSRQLELDEDIPF